MRKFLAAAVITLGLLALVGASPRGTYQGGSYGVSTGSYQAGGGPAGRDTISIVLTMDRALDHEFATYDAAVANADSVYALTHADRQFAYALIDKARPDTVSYWRADANNNNIIKLRPAVGGWDLTDDADTRPLIIHFDPDVPPGASIVSARLKFRTVSTTLAATDTITATLMTLAGDGVWWQHKGIYDAATRAFSTDIADYLSKSSYNHQVWFNPAATKFGYDEATSDAWSPALLDRRWYWDWGSVSDWTSPGTLNAYTGEMSFDITNCVQGIASGLTNNGIAIFLKKSSVADFYMTAFEPRSDDATALTRRPWIEIKYVTKRYSSPFPSGADWAFIFHMPDATVRSGDSLRSVAEEFGAKITFDMSYFYIGNGTYITWPFIFDAIDSGHELAYHTYQHNSYTDYAITDTTVAGWDALKNQFKPSYMRNYVTANGRPDLVDNPRFMRTLSPTAGGQDPYAHLLARLLGYDNIRMSYTAYASGDYIAVTTNNNGAAWARAAASDTARIGAVTAKDRYARPMNLIPLTMPVTRIASASDNKHVPEDSLKYNFRKLVRQVRADGRRAIMLYTHGTKTDPNVVTEALDPEELRWMLEVAVEEGAAFMTIAEFGAWIRQWATAVDSPDRAAVPDTFESTAADRVWFKPDGVDNRFIPGVR
jgi:hypothetical protein